MPDQRNDTLAFSLSDFDSLDARWLFTWLFDHTAPSLIDRQVLL
jgi:hypothetical protein